MWNHSISTCLHFVFKNSLIMPHIVLMRYNCISLEVLFVRRGTRSPIITYTTLATDILYIQIIKIWQNSENMTEYIFELNSSTLPWTDIIHFRAYYFPYGSLPQYICICMVIMFAAKLYTSNACRSKRLYCVLYEVLYHQMYRHTQRFKSTTRHSL